MSLLTLVLLPALLAVVNSEFPLAHDIDFSDLPILRNEVDPTIYRVPESLDPIHFEVEITPYFEAEEGKEEFTFDGIVTLSLRAVEDEISVLVLQENVRHILEVSVTTEAGVPLLLNQTNPFTRVRDYHFLNINLADGITLVNGDVYIVKIAYIGNINETPLSRGLFRGYYRDEQNNLHYYAACHLQPTHARQLFPSFDEPGFKSTFTIIINRPAHFGPSHSNMHVTQEIPFGNRVKEIFNPTPRMSAYLISVHISEAFTVIADNNNSTASYRILARPNAQGQGQYALDIGLPVSDWLSDYFGIEYYHMDVNIKNDQIAVPDWASGATENWGLVSYREVRLLYEEGETNALDKMYIGTITAHELAHKWFGNLITCRWWDNVWINEGFASYFEYFAMDGVDKSMELEDQFNIMYLQSALSADSGTSTRALQHTVNSPSDVTGHFSGISYSKGASLLLMVKHFVTEDVFKRALNHFLLTHSYEHTYPEDLYDSFEVAVQEANLNLGTNIRNFLQYWVDEQGYPVLNVNVNFNTGLISLSQERFFLSASATPTQQAWPLPLTYTTGSNPNWDDLTASHVMTGATDQIQIDAADEWVIFNVKQKGIYRVNYNQENWEKIIEVLKNDRESIHFLNRAQIVDDVFALMRSERMTYEFGFRILDFLKDETNYFVWYPAVTGFTWLRNRLLHIPDALEEFNKILYEFLDAVITDVTYDVGANESLTRTLNRFFILAFACNIGHEGCINDALTKFRALRTSGTSVNPNLRRHVFCVGLHEGNYDDWSFLSQRRIQSNNQGDNVAMLRSLGCTTNENAVQEQLRNILDDDIVKAQDRVNAFTFLYMGDRANTRPVLEFLKDNVDEIRRKVVLQANFNGVISTLASYMDEDGLQEYEAWLRANPPLSTVEQSSGLSAITSTRANMQWGTANADIILEAARGSAVIVLPTLMLLFTTLITMYLQ